MFRDEFRRGNRPEYLRFAVRAHFKRLPFDRAATNIRLSFRIAMFDFVFHRNGEIGFPVERARDDGDGATRNQFANEDHAAPPGIGRFFRT